MGRHFKYKSGTALTVVLCAFCFHAATLQAQSTAAEWFERGMSSQNIDDKIAAFEQATELEPNFVEGLFYLGLAYKAKGMFAEAEVAFNKAYFTNPYALNNDIKLRILFELGTVHATLGNISQARDAFKGARDLSVDNRTLQGRIAYELGQIYMQEGEYTQAVAELRAGRQLWRQNAQAFDALIEEASKKQAINNLYGRGLTLLQDEKYTQAVTVLEQVVAQDPQFREVQAKLRQARAGRENSEPKVDLADLYRQADRQIDRGNRARAIELLTQIINTDTQYRDAQQRLQQLRDDTREEAQKEQQQQVERAYQSGVTAMQAGDWRLALSRLAQVRRLAPGYKDVDARITRVNRAIRTLQDSEAKTEQLYEQAVELMQKREWRHALDTFKQLQELDGGYKDVATQLETIRAQLMQEKTRLDSLYEIGATAMQNEKWLRAILAFEKVRELNPTYRDIAAKLAEAEQRLNQREETASISIKGMGGSALVWIGATVLCLVLPVGGVLMFSPTARARLYLLHGDYSKAAQIYEQIIERRPEKLKLYPILANIYLLEDRRDEQAIKMFERILKLNILMPRRAEINSIVANYYLTEGRTDGNAIAIMERELSNKIKKIQSGAA